MSFAGVNKLGEKTTVGKCLESIYKEKIKGRIGGKEILKVFFLFKNLIEVTVARRVPGVYVILSLARPGKYLEYIPQNKIYFFLN